MTHLADVYRPSLALSTDLYQLTMLQAYHSAGIAEREACFHLFFRQLPFGSGYAVASGIGDVAPALEALEFTPADVDWLAELRGEEDRPLFDDTLLSALSRFELVCDVDAVPEGEVVFAQEPLVRVTGPLWQAQLLETLLLTVVNFQTLIATKASRVVAAAAGRPVLEFGLRRAQGVDGGLSVARAAWIGGVAGTSNVLAGRLHGVPVKGTHAHSFVLAFDSERSAFEAWAKAMPHNSTLLIDTFETRRGIANAIAVGKELAAAGERLKAVRLDSGDLVALSLEVRRRLDEAGLVDTKILASNELDEHRISALLADGAKLDAFGVGTRLATAHDSPSLGGVYKLTAMRDGPGAWRGRAKLSDDPAKISHPGRLGVRRFESDGGYVADAIHDIDHAPEGDWSLVDAGGQPVRVDSTASAELLRPVLQRGKLVGSPPTPSDARQLHARALAALPGPTRELVDPRPYPVLVEAGQFARALELVESLRESAR